MLSLCHHSSGLVRKVFRSERLHSSCNSGFDLLAPSSTGIGTCRSEPLDLLPHDFTNKYLGQMPMSNRVLQKLCTGGEVPVSKVAQFSESSYS